MSKKPSSSIIATSTTTENIVVDKNSSVITINIDPDNNSQMSKKNQFGKIPFKPQNTQSDVYESEKNSIISQPSIEKSPSINTSNIKSESKSNSNNFAINDNNSETSKKKQIINKSSQNNQPSNQYNIQPSNQPSNQYNNPPSNQPSNQPNNQPINKSNNHLSNQPSNQLSNEPSSRSNKQSSSQPSNQPIISRSQSKVNNESFSNEVNLKSNDPSSSNPVFDNSFGIERKESSNNNLNYSFGSFKESANDFKSQTSTNNEFSNFESNTSHVQLNPDLNYFNLNNLNSQNTTDSNVYTFSSNPKSPKKKSNKQLETDYVIPSFNDEDSITSNKMKLKKFGSKQSNQMKHIASKDFAKEIEAKEKEKEKEEGKKSIIFKEAKNNDNSFVDSPGEEDEKDILEVKKYFNVDFNTKKNEAPKIEEFDLNLVEEFHKFYKKVI